MNDKAGRPTVVTEQVLSKLKAVLQRGISVKKACIYARIGEKTFYRHYNNDSVFRQFIEDCRDYVTIVAGEVITEDITKNKNVSTAKWWVERKDSDEFSLKQNFNVFQNGPNSSYEFITDDEFRSRARLAGVDKLNPKDIADALSASNG
ncbi:hypothetical protein KBD45_06200 [Candidatus Dojkabacteria bacterium]|nr:hypothetical protein [Candidatus Dojkabacteria bacterium]